MMQAKVLTKFYTDQLRVQKEKKGKTNIITEREKLDGTTSRAESFASGYRIEKQSLTKKLVQINMSQKSSVVVPIFFP